MTAQADIDQYIASQTQPKRGELEDLHRRIVALAPRCKLWFLDGRDAAGKVVSNPSVGYGSVTREYARGERREFYRVGISANTAGISIYVMGLDDKRYLSETYGGRLGKAKVTGYCIKLKSTRDVAIDLLEEIVADALDVRPSGVER